MTAIEWLAHNWEKALTWLVAFSGWPTFAFTVWSKREAPKLHFRMRAEIMPANHLPREVLIYSFRNSGKAPVHITNIEGDQGFTFIDGERNYFDPMTVNVDPEPTTGDVPAAFVLIMRKRPKKVWAIDSTERKWPLPAKDLKKIYEVLEEFRATPENRRSAEQDEQT